MIFFLGNFYNYNHLKKHKNVSAAASEWKFNFVNKLQNILKKKINSIQYYKCRTWPLESLYVNKNNFSNLQKTKYISYFNLPILRNFFLKKKIIEYITSKSNEKNNTIFTYNFSKIDISTALYLKNVFSFNWILICADFNQKDYYKLHQIFRLCDCVIFLSYHAFKNYKYKNKIFYNGSSTYFKKKPTKKIKNFLYSGSLGDWTDIDNFLENFYNIDDKKIKFFITSNNTSHKIDSFLHKDLRIKFLGFLKDKEYKKLIKKIDCFVSLRNENNKDNDNNFPSKIIKYLSFNLPIISSNMKNISKEVKDVLIMKKKDDSYQHLIESVLKYSKEDINKQKIKIMKYHRINKAKESLTLNKMIKNFILIYDKKNKIN